MDQLLFLPVSGYLRFADLHLSVVSTIVFVLLGDRGAQRLVETGLLPVFTESTHYRARKHICPKTRFQPDPKTMDGAEFHLFRGLLGLQWVISNAL